MAGLRDSQWCISVFQRFERSVVRLNFRSNFRGTGFVVYWEEPGTCLIMTCYHVCSDLPMDATLYAYFSGINDPCHVHILHRGNDNRDLALLRVHRMSSQVSRPVVMEFFERPVQQGWDVVLLGYNVLRDNFILEPSTWFGRIM